MSARLTSQLLGVVPVLFVRVGYAIAGLPREAGAHRRAVARGRAAGYARAPARAAPHRNAQQQVIIENRPGANSIIGTEAVAKSPPDGYTYLLTTGSHVHNAALYAKLPYDTLKDFVSLTLVAETAGMVLGVHPSVPAKSVKELVALAKQQPGKLTFGSAGNGNTLHLAGELFKASTGTDITHVPYKGAAPRSTISWAVIST